ncbi:MAG: DUF359 domain-containing protein [Methanosphaera stadtmanae]|nr:DUF359 domain-containing protein [Methanosphaera stadtmanae]
MLRVPKSLRKDLKKPLGQLYDSIDQITETLQKQLSDDKLLIGIGDVTTRKLVEMNLTPQICMVDNLIERRPVQHNLDHTENIKKVSNPPGTLTEGLIQLIIESLETSTQSNQIIIEVDGEEDLAVLPAILNAPMDTIILYGQPHEGIVLVKVEEAYDMALNYYNQLIQE